MDNENNKTNEENLDHTQEINLENTDLYQEKGINKDVSQEIGMNKEFSQEENANKDFPQTNINKDFSSFKEKKKNTKRLPSLGIAIMILVSSVLGGLAGAFGVRYYDSFNTPSGSSSGVNKESNLSNNVVTTSLPKNNITKVAEEVGPAVVGISTTKSSWRDATSSESAGSGIVFDSNGYIVTNQHVIAGGTKIMVSLPSGKKAEAKVVGQDAKSDLAVLKVEAKDLKAAKFGNSDSLRVGDSVIAIGNPLGEEFAGSVTAGILSAKQRNMNIREEGYSRTYNVLQTDASINPGSSGGALFNEAGEVVGINTLKISSAEGMGFAIPINEAKEIIKELMDSGYIKRPFLGVSTIYLDSETAKMYNIPSGMGVQQVVKGSAAEKAGIISGDIITEIDGKKIEGENDLTNAVSKKKIGDKLTLKIVNEKGSTKTVTATLEENKNEQQ